jgi:hypothetical protein
MALSPADGNQPLARTPMQSLWSFIQLFRALRIEGKIERKRQRFISSKALQVGSSSPRTLSLYAVRVRFSRSPSAFGLSQSLKKGFQQFSLGNNGCDISIGVTSKRGLANVDSSGAMGVSLMCHFLNGLCSMGYGHR